MEKQYNVIRATSSVYTLQRRITLNILRLKW